MSDTCAEKLAVKPHPAMAFSILLGLPTPLAAADTIPAVPIHREYPPLIADERPMLESDPGKQKRRHRLGGTVAALTSRDWGESDSMPP